MKHITIISLVALVLAAQPAAAWHLLAGWTRSDVGLNDDGDGLTVAVGETWPIGDGPFDASAAAEYAQRAGSQPMVFSDPDRGPVVGDAEVRLHMFQPSFSLGLRLPVGGLVPRVYVGAAVAVKMSEQWTKPEGGTNRVYGYEDVDALVHAGASVAMGRFFVDARIDRGLMEQLVDRDYDTAGGWAKASDPLEGVKEPVAGDQVTTGRLALGMTF